MAVAGDENGHSRLGFSKDRRITPWHIRKTAIKSRKTVKSDTMEVIIWSWGPRTGWIRKKWAARMQRNPKAIAYIAWAPDINQLFKLMFSCRITPYSHWKSSSNPPCPERSFWKYELRRIFKLTLLANYVIGWQSTVDWLREWDLFTVVVYQPE